MRQKKVIQQIRLWSMLLLALFLMACSSGGSTEGSEVEPAVGYGLLEVSVSTPGLFYPTRGDVGDVPASNKENAVNSLQIWAFKHNDGAKVSYMQVEDITLLNVTGQVKYQMEVDRAFANKPEKVDVYVVANAATCDWSFDGNTTRSQLDEAKIGTAYFGTETLVGSVPEKGLPMSAVLHDQPIYGRYPTMRIGTSEKIETLQLTRAVSKLRIVLCRIKEDLTKTRKKLVSIDQIQIDGNQIPKESYLMQRATNSYEYDHALLDYGAVALDTLPEVKDPVYYAYETQSATAYDQLIDDAVGGRNRAEGDPDPPLVQRALNYFRESDKQLTGVVKYKIQERPDVNQSWGAETSEEATFTMAAPGDFLRNHSWIVYIFFMDMKIHVLTVTNIGMKDWTNGGSTNHTVYNW